MTATVPAQAHYQTASAVLGQLCTIVLPKHRTPGGTQAVEFVPGAFDGQWAAGLALPVGDQRGSSQTVALVTGLDTRRETDPAAVALAYQALPRTRVYESIHARSGGWPALVALHLAGLLRRRVIAALYESQPGDRTLGAHDDAWWGVIMQMRGAKTWRLWPSWGGAPYEITTRAGDVLLLPKGVTHQVSTPSRPGHSVHLVYAVTDEPLDVA
jgi:Cupin superfamily protein